MLHRMTAIFPPDKVLDGSVDKLDNFPIDIGPSSEIWRGVWLGEEMVALKRLRNVKANDKAAQKVV